MEMKVSRKIRVLYRADYQPLLNNINNLNLPTLFAALCNPLNRKSQMIRRFAPYQICARLKSTQQTPGLMDSFQSAMELVEQKVSTNLQKVRLIGSRPKLNCNMHSYLPKILATSQSATSQSASNNLKRAPDRDNDGSQLPPSETQSNLRCLLFHILSPPPINSPTLNLFLFLIRPHHRLPKYPHNGPTT
ncbi:hypothetical protein CEXT_402111 [Caerostris extrusa]|uniref:Uncharacterized protein n=1 Tax=Caerostris extrusa TaxID=172846 RepID=A0AAV4PQG2_CAEEX|nr:hypothetical protein CEXT_402111 [Caerostris extrusa]